MNTSQPEDHQRPLRGNVPIVAAVGLVLFVVWLAWPSDKPRRNTATPVGQEPTKTRPTVPGSAVDSQAGRGSTAADPLAADFVHLYDVSSSVHTGDANDPFIRAVRNLKPSLDALKEAELLLPQRHRVGTVGAASLLQQSVCDLRIDPAGVFKKTEGSQVNSRIDACDRAMRTRSVETASDIRGALTYATLSLQGPRKIVRGIVLVTDLEEFIPKGQTPASPDLGGICVAVYSVVTKQVMLRPDSLKIREAAWRKQLKVWGAKDVLVQSVLGFNAEDLTKYFNDCRR